MVVGPDMSEKVIELLRSQRYDVRFKMRFRDKATLMGGGSDQFSTDPRERAASHKVSPVRNSSR
jgi:hypothetical protein